MLDFESLRQIADESERVSKTYEIFDEDTRLNRSKAAKIEFLTTVHYVEKYIRPNDKILDIGAGAGEYSLYFASRGYDVAAIELVKNNINAFEKKLRPEYNIDLRQGNALDLSDFADNSFEIVLLLGPLYHLQSEDDRQRCIAEAKRVCKDDGIIFFAFISNDMVILTEFCYSLDFFNGDSYDHETFKVVDFPFVFFTVDESRRMLKLADVKIISEVASDGVSEMIADKINATDDESYEQYLKYHLYCCEKAEMLGRSNHLLFLGRK